MRTPSLPSEPPSEPRAFSFSPYSPVPSPMGCPLKFPPTRPMDWGTPSSAPSEPPAGACRAPCAPLPQESRTSVTTCWMAQYQTLKRPSSEAPGPRLRLENGSGQERPTLPGRRSLVHPPATALTRAEADVQASRQTFPRRLGPSSRDGSNGARVWPRGCGGRRSHPRMSRTLGSV